MWNWGKCLVMAAIGAAILAGVWAAGPPLNEEYVPRHEFGALEPGPVVLEPKDDDLSVPFDPNCPHVDPRLLRMPWEEVERAACWEPARDGTRLLAYAVARAVYERGWGSAFAVAREADGTISLYRVEGEPDAIEEAYSLAYGGLYMRPVEPWRPVARSASLGELLAWMRADVGGLGEEAKNVFEGSVGGLRAWLAWPASDDASEGD
jgi:hypothetical protein